MPPDDATWTVQLGDCRKVLPLMPEAYVDSVVCDPPYELGFMGKAWDRTGIAYDVDMWRAVLRVMKPGAHLVAFGGTRTHHRVACAVEAAGFEIRDCLQWLFGSGFPKSLNVSKAIDNAAGAAGDRKIIGANPTWREAKRSNRIMEPVRGGSAELITAPATPEAEQWDGWGTALKPAYEPIILARKPLSGTVAANVLAHGTGAINIDGCRVPTDWNEPDRPDSWKRSGHTADADADKIAAPPGNGIECHPGGRWPPNVLLTHDANCGAECVDGCPVRMLDEQAGVLHTHGGHIVVPTMGYGGAAANAHRERKINSECGTASRFFPRFRYCSKASTAEREAGCEELTAAQRDDGRTADAPGANNPRNRGGQLRRNTCPTVKPLDIMRWLVRLVTPRGGLVLDHFTGSGSTGCAAIIEGMRFFGIDADPVHIKIAEARIAHVHAIHGQLPRDGEPKKADPWQVELFR
jgi:site-specific DNA-methyltransferase (adenine-specific)